jgi:hypothetical protein
VNDRRGFSAVETVAALLLLLLLLQAAWSLTAGAARLASSLSRRADGLAARRSLSWVLQEELASARAALDVVPAQDSFRLRAFRGTAVPCRRSGSALVVRYRGRRAPQADEDSVLALTAEGRWLTSALAGRTPAPAGCLPGPGVAEEWRLVPPVDQVSLLRLFEPGSYHLSDGVFRYRAGSGVRQPLTPAVFSPASSGISAGPHGRLVVRGTLSSPDGGVLPGTWVRSYRLTGSW